MEEKLDNRRDGEESGFNAELLLQCSRSRESALVLGRYCKFGGFNNDVPILVHPRPTYTSELLYLRT